MNMKVFAILACILSGILCVCFSSCEEGKGSKKHESAVFESGSIRVDTLTINGHRYLLTSGAMGTPQLQHEASCEMKDYEALMQKKNVFVFSKKDSLHKPVNLMGHTISFKSLQK